MQKKRTVRVWMVDQATDAAIWLMTLAAASGLGQLLAAIWETEL